MNVVFDIGGVVVEWQPARLAAAVFDDVEKQQVATNDVFSHADWVGVDRGDLSYEEAIERTANRTSLTHDDVNRLFRAVAPSLVPKPASLDLIQELSRSEHRLFALSNMGQVGYEYLQRHHGIWSRFEASVVSCLVNRVKPEPEIFHYLLDQYALTPAETIFIDDMAENAAAAEALGIRAIHFTSTEQCRRELAAIIAW